MGRQLTRTEHYVGNGGHSVAIVTGASIVPFTVLTVVAISVVEALINIWWKYK